MARTPRKTGRKNAVKSNVRLMPLDGLTIDEGVQPREQLDLGTVREYAEAIAAGAHLPPVIAFNDGERLWLADGFHRAASHQQAGRAKIAVDERAGTKRDAILYAVGANAAHGHRRTNEDKRKAVGLLLEDPEWSQWSNREIARRCVVDEYMVRKMREERPTAGKPQMRRCKRGDQVYEMDISGRSSGAGLTDDAWRLVRDTRLRDESSTLRELSRVARADQAAVAKAMLDYTGCNTVAKGKAFVERQRKLEGIRLAAERVKLSDEDCRIITGDSLEVLPTLEAGSIDLICTDPMYNIGWRYHSGDDARPASVYLEECDAWVRECARLLSPHGSMFVVIASRWAYELETLLRGAGLHRRESIVWSESFGRYTRDRLADDYRLILWFSKDAERFMFDGETVLVKSTRLKDGDTRAIPDGRVPGNFWREDEAADPAKKNVWKFQRVVGNAAEKIPDPAPPPDDPKKKLVPPQLPVKLVERIVLMASKAGDTVLDPFSGTGTAARACIPNGRRFIGVEIDAEVARQSMVWIKAALAERREGAEKQGKKGAVA